MKVGDSLLKLWPPARFVLYCTVLYLLGLYIFLFLVLLWLLLMLVDPVTVCLKSSLSPTLRSDRELESDSEQASWSTT